jgi:hypothetical protein
MTPAEAALRIRALVSGLPPDEGRARLLFMAKAYQTYVDASGKGDTNWLIIAGYVAPADVWSAFSGEWQKRLNQAGIERFKMTEWRSRPECAAWFYRLIEEAPITGAISVALNTAELVKVVRAFDWPPEVRHTEKLENPYYLGFKAITDLMAQKQGDFEINEPVDFIFDDDSEKNLTQAGWDMLLFSSAPEFRKNMGATPHYEKDERAKPLQAADPYAWWVRKWTSEGVAEWLRDLPFPWQKNRDIRRMHLDLREADFLAEFKKGLSPEALARSQITDPKAALKELERRERGVTFALPDPSSPWKWRL